MHESKPPSKLEAVEVVSALFQFCSWLASTYGRSSKPDRSARFDPHRLMDAVYESPFISVAPEGPEAIFVKADVDELFDVLQQLHDAVAA